MSIRCAFKGHVARTLLVYLFIASFLSGCDLFSGGDDNTDLDDQLEAALVEASNGQGILFFNMPDSDDFSSIPEDPNNPLSAKKVELGQLLFHDPGLLVNNVRPEGRFSASCASCHHAKAGFQAGRIQGIGEGGIGFGARGEARINDLNYAIEDLDIQPIRSPSAMNGAYQKVHLWNGQFGATGPNTGTESQWTADTPKEENYRGYEGLETQAIAGLKVHRMGDVDESVVATNETYQQLFAEAFSSAPIDQEHAGLAIAAFERTLLSNQAPFQRWLDGERNAMTDQEKRGALVFFTKAACVDCHTGPALNSMTFYALGMNDLEGPGVYGNPAEDLSRFGRSSFTGNPEDDYKFKTPQLYNLTDSPFFGHGGSFKNVREVIEYKNNAIPQNEHVPERQLAEAFVPLGLNDDEINDLVAFIEMGLNDPELNRYVPEELPSGLCLVVNDSLSRGELGC